MSVIFEPSITLCICNKFIFWRVKRRN